MPDSLWTVPSGWPRPLWRLWMVATSLGSKVPPGLCALSTSTLTIATEPSLSPSCPESPVLKWVYLAFSIHFSVSFSVHFSVHFSVSFSVHFSNHFCPLLCLFFSVHCSVHFYFSVHLSTQLTSCQVHHYSFSSWWSRLYHQSCCHWPVLYYLFGHVSCPSLSLLPEA